MRKRAIRVLLLLINRIVPAADTGTTLFTTILTPGLMLTIKVLAGITSVATLTTCCPGSKSKVLAQVIVVVPRPVAARVDGLVSNSKLVGVTPSAVRL